MIKQSSHRLGLGCAMLDLLALFCRINLFLKNIEILHVSNKQFLAAIYTLFSQCDANLILEQ